MKVQTMRLMRVVRSKDRDEFHDWTVSVSLTGSSIESDTPGADSVGRTVHRVARQSKAGSIEAFAQELADSLLENDAKSTAAEITVESHLWKRLTADAESCPTAFMKGSDERQTTRVTRSRTGQNTVVSGFSNMILLNTAVSGLDQPQGSEPNPACGAGSCLFSTAMMANWTYSVVTLGAPLHFDQLRRRVREAMIATFATRDAPNGQEVLGAMARAALESTSEIEEITLRVTNRPYVLVIADRALADHANEVYSPEDKLNEVLEITLRRR